MTTALVLQLLTALGLGAVIVEAVRSFTQRKKMGADYADVISASAVRLLDPLENRIQDLEQQVIEAKTELGEAVDALRQERQKREEERVLREEERRLREEERRLRALAEEELRVERVKRVEAETQLAERLQLPK
jgi:hypothetical protein